MRTLKPEVQRPTMRVPALLVMAASACTLLYDTTSADRDGGADLESVDGRPAQDSEAMPPEDSGSGVGSDSGVGTDATPMIDAAPPGAPDASGASCDVLSPSCPSPSEACYWGQSGTGGTCLNEGDVADLDYCDFQWDCRGGSVCSYIGCVQICSDVSECPGGGSGYECTEIIGGEPVKGCFPL